MRDRVATDIGGTFTDFVALEESTGRLTPSTYSCPGDIRASAFTITPPSIPPTPKDSTSSRVISCGQPSTCLGCASIRVPGSSSTNPEAGHELDDDALLDPLEFLAGVLIHVPEPNKHLVHFYRFRDANPSAAIQVMADETPMTHYGHIERPQQLAGALLAAVKWLIED